MHRPKKRSLHSISRPGQRGFTLVEVMISLVITSMIVTTLYSALASVAKSWNRGTEQSATANQRRAGINLVRRELTQLAPLRLRTRGGETIVFKGDAHELTFAAPIPSHRASGGLFLVRFTVERDGAVKNVAFRYTRLSVERVADIETDNDDWDSTVVIAGIEKAVFEYFGDTGAGKSWEQSWTSVTEYPEAIRLRLEFQPQEAEWPDIVLPIPAHPEQRIRRLALMLRESQPARQTRGVQHRGSALPEEPYTDGGTTL